jgi:hypothetical protein
MEPKTVRAKFTCVEIKKAMGGTYDSRGKYVPGVLHGYRFNPVVGDSEENKKFFSSTPTGLIELHSVRDDLFELGKEYYVDFTLFVFEPAPAIEAKEEE